MTFMTPIIGVNTFIKPWPIVALSSSKRSDRTRVLFAQPSDVLSKSPAALESAFCTNANRNATFSCSDILAVVLPKPFAKAYSSRAD